MATLAAIRTALAETAKAGVASQLFAYDKMPDSPQLPALIVEPTDVDFAAALSQQDCWYFNVYVLCARTDSTVAQTVLDGFLSGGGPDSVRRAIYEREDLGLPNTTATVLGMTGYGGNFEGNRLNLVGALLRVRVYTDGRA